MDSRILIVDDLATNRILLRARLAAASYQVRVAGSAAEALRALEAAGVALVLIEASLPGSDGFALCRRLRAEAEQQGHEGAVLLLMVPPGDAEPVRAGFAAGADAVLQRPVSEPMLLARIRNLLRRRSARAALVSGAETCRAAGLAAMPGGAALLPPRAPVRPRIALVSDLASAALKLRSLLAAQSPGDYAILGAQAALAGAHLPAGPDLYLIAHDGVAGTRGLERGRGARPPALALLSELHARCAARRAELCLLMPEADGTTELLALDLGAAEVMTNAQLRGEAGARLGALLVRKQRHDALAASVEAGLRAVGRDVLTGICDRRSGLAQLQRLAKGPPRPELGIPAAAPPLAVLMLDVDRFKAINDRYGHAAGDAVLIEVAARLQGRLGSGDLLARIGGEEFLIGLPAAPMPQALAIAEDLRRAVARQPVPVPGSPRGIDVTLSLGLALAEPGADPAAALRRADAALFEAKRGGRNRVECAAMPVPHPV